MLRRIEWLRPLHLLGFSAVLGCCVLLGSESERGIRREPASFTRTPSIGEEPSGVEYTRLREGMRLSDVPGHFEVPAEGPVFIDQSGRRLAGLENLHLQRIARTLVAADEPASLQWKVSGLITEYEGRNFILVERAVYTPTRQ